MSHVDCRCVECLARREIEAARAQERGEWLFANLAEASAAAVKAGTELARVTAERDEAHWIAEDRRIALDSCIASENRLTEDLANAQAQLAALRAALEEIASTDETTVTEPAAPWILKRVDRALSSDAGKPLLDALRAARAELQSWHDHLDQCGVQDLATDAALAKIDALGLE